MHRDKIELLLDRSETGFLVNSTEKMEKQRVNGGEFNQCSDEVQHVALDIGGSLIKVVYFSGNDCGSFEEQETSSSKGRLDVPNGNQNYCVLKGKLHFMKFETRKINDCIEFLSSKKFRCHDDLHHEDHTSDSHIVKATGGGAFRYADLFKEKLGITLDKVDEMDSLVAGANFLLKAVKCEAFTYMDDKKDYVQIDHKDLYPYLLVNIGSGVSMIKVVSLYILLPINFIIEVHAMKQRKRSNSFQLRIYYIT